MILLPWAAFSIPIVAACRQKSTHFGSTFRNNRGAQTATLARFRDLDNKIANWVFSLSSHAAIKFFSNFGSLGLDLSPRAKARHFR
jgi:hypothetical protein